MGLPVRIVAHDGAWTAVCSAELEAIRSAIAPTRAFIDHVGSTAVPGLDGKPIVDLLVTLVDWSDADAVTTALEGMGYRLGSAHDAPPRRFLQREIQGRSVEAVHLHLTPSDSPYGRDMVVFRDALVGDAGLAQRYVALKRELAIANSHDLDAYTAGKSEFVAKVLLGTSGAFGNDRLLTHQRAELDKAQRYRNRALTAQVCVALIAAVSVYSNSNAVQLDLALLGFLLAFVWFTLSRKQRAHRSAGDQARRVVLLASGLGERFTAGQRLRIFDKFTVSVIDAAPVREEAYFASRSAPGYQRLAELIEESAYWTRELQRASATVLQSVSGFVIALMASGLWLGIPMLPSDATISIARVLVALLVFMLSSDVVGAILAHREAASTIAEILQRIETAAARGYPAADVLLLMSDYNATVESAPFALPGIFRWKRASLTVRWRTYLEHKRH